MISVTRLPVVFVRQALSANGLSEEEAGRKSSNLMISWCQLHLVIFSLYYDTVSNITARPGPVCCPEVYRDVPGKFHDHDDDDVDDDDDWRSSINVEVPRGGRIKPLLKIFNEWKSLTGVGNFILIEDLQRM